MLFSGDFRSSKMSNSTVPFVINAAFNFPFCLIASVGNFLILLSFARTPSLLSPSNVLLIGLAISDFCVGLIAQPVYIAWKFHQHVNHQTPTMLGVLGKACMFVSSLLCAVSFCIVSSLSMEKYLAVYLHLRYNGIVTVRRVSYAVVLIWFPCLVAASLSIWQYGYFEFIAAVVSLLCLLVNAVLYFKIYRVVRRHQLQVWNQLTVFCTVSPNSMTAGFKRSFVNIFYLYLVCLVCYVPYISTAINVLIQGGMDAPIPAKLAFEVSWTIAYINSSLNPLLFSWRLRDIRAAVKSTLKELLC